MQNLTYQQATERLEQIMQQIEHDQLDVDSLLETLTEAKSLVEFCKQRLMNVEKSVKETISDDQD